MSSYTRDPAERLAMLEQLRDHLHARIDQAIDTAARGVWDDGGKPSLTLFNGGRTAGDDAP
jgi:hypothetical protein